MTDWKKRVDEYCEWLRTGKGDKPNLRDANLHGADLRDATLRYADLRYANLHGADLRDANLRYADLRAPTMILLASWGEVSDKTTLALMRLDCSACPDGKKRFDNWVKTDVCPYDDARVHRVANFTEKKSLWKYGPPPSIWNCMCMVLDEKCPGWRVEDD